MRASWTVIAALAVVGCGSSAKTTGQASLSVTVAPDPSSPDGGFGDITISATSDSGAPGTGTVHVYSDYGSLNSTGNTNVDVKLDSKGNASATIDCTTSTEHCKAGKVRVVVAWEGLEAISSTGGGELPAVLSNPGGSSGGGGSSGNGGSVNWADCSQQTNIVVVESEFGHQTLTTNSGVGFESYIIGNTPVAGEFSLVFAVFSETDGGSLDISLQAGASDGGSAAIVVGAVNLSPASTVDLTQLGGPAPIEGPISPSTMLAPCSVGPFSWKAQELVVSGGTIESFGATFSVTCLDHTVLSGCVRATSH